MVRQMTYFQWWNGSCVKRKPSGYLQECSLSIGLSNRNATSLDSTMRFLFIMPGAVGFCDFERALAWVRIFKLSREREEMASLSNVESVASSVTPPCVDFISKWDGPSRTNRAIFDTSATEASSQTNQETPFPAAPLVHSSPIKKSNAKMLSLKEEINDPNFLCLGVSSPVKLPGTSETNQVLGRGFVGALEFRCEEETNDTNYLNKGLISGATSSTKTLRVSHKTNEGKDHPGMRNSLPTIQRLRKERHQ